MINNMNKFGEIKTKILTKLSESYSEKNKNEIKDILNTLKSNKLFVETYLLYEDIENKHISSKEVATHFVEELGKSLKGRSSIFKPLYKKLNEKMKDVQPSKNKIYENLDVLMENDNLLNIEKKYQSKSELIKYLTEEKKQTETYGSVFTENESLLAITLANDFNSYFENVLGENEKKELQTIIEMNEETIVENTENLKNDILKKVNSLILESTDKSLIDKLNDVKKQVENSTPSKYSYYKLTQLKNGLD
jgi:hypothetical protein